MIDENTKIVNRKLAKGLAYCSLSLFILLILGPIGVFDFSRQIIMTIICVGLPTTLGPMIFVKFKASDNFIKYYIMVMMSVLIGMLGTQNGIGIYITYIMVPIVSCLYFSKRFTMYMGIFSYFTMTLGVYYNCAGKLEVVYKGWSHWLTFRNYMIGFTLEYVVVMVFVLLLVDRSQQFFRMQQENLMLQQQENDKQKKIVDFYANAITGRKATVFEAISDDMDKFTTEDFVKMTAGQRFTTTIQEMLKSAESEADAMKRALDSIGDYFDLERMIYIEPDYDEKRINRLTYSWAAQDKYKLKSFYNNFGEEDYNIISGEYDKNGFILLNPGADDYDEVIKRLDCGLVRFICSIAIGSQLWIPTIEAGNYSGAVCFEKLGNIEFSKVDILILADVVGVLSMYVMSKNAQRANEAKSAFLSSMSHEIRTPMNAIIGMTTVALREDMNQNVRKSLSIIKSSSEGLLAIINDILDFSKIESGKMEIVSEDYMILSLINDVRTIVESRNADKGLDLRFVVPDDLPSVLRGDMVRIKQVMVNLANNAIKYTDKGSVTIEISCEYMSDDTVMFQFKVTDTGQGIRDEDKNKLFKSFSQVNQSQNHHKEGTGLGLAISKQLVELMGGAIGYDSKYGEGSMFFFAVPQTVVDASAAGRPEDYDYNTESGSAESGCTFPGAKVLIVDDNSVNRMVAEALFGVFRMDLSFAEGGADAIEKSKKEKFDIIFMDHFMPDIDGLTATGIIRSDVNNINKDTVIVALTADAMNGVKEKMLSAGMNDFLTKPIDMKKVTKVLKKYLS